MKTKTKTTTDAAETNIFLRNLIKTNMASSVVFLLNQAIDLVFDESEEENDDEIEMIVAALNVSANSRTKATRIKK